MTEKIKIEILHLSEDDPKKCTARKLAKFGHARLVKRLNAVSYNPILLDPYSPKVLSKEDLPQALEHGLLIFDCSWDGAENTFDRIRAKKKMAPRALPFLVAVNPVNYGKAFQLSTLEALAGALIVLGYRHQAIELLGLYKWSANFLKMNEQPLLEYENAKSSEEIIKAQKEFI
jgi:pre-rRNA-processing protein TSR3